MMMKKKKKKKKQIIELKFEVHNLYRWTRPLTMRLVRL